MTASQEAINVRKNLYEIRNPENLKFRSNPGITEELVRQISKDKNEPNWMLKKRLKALEIFNKKPVPTWGPDLSDLNLNEISLYVRPNANRNSTKWEDVPTEIKNTFERLGIPKAERESLGGVGAQYESEIIYHNMKKELKKKGVIFMDCDEALQKHPELFKKYFMTSCIPPTLHKFAALHAAVWSGGTFIYIPKGVKLKEPLQAYFRMNAQKAGQFEHTLIIADEDSEVHYIEGCSAPQYRKNSLHAGGVEIHVLKGARVRYTSIENWSKNTYNLNTKRAIAHENSVIEWINGNLGSKTTMLYPCSVLQGDNSKTDYIGIAYAGESQIQDTGCKAIHIGKNTSSNILSKGISKNGGTSSYRGLVKILPKAFNAKSSVRCDGLMLDNFSKALTFPSMDVRENEIKVSHEAAVGKIGEDQLFYLMSRGLDEEDAIKLIVSGFIEPVIKELPLEYAAELNKLIELEIENSVC